MEGFGKWKCLKKPASLTLTSLIPYRDVGYLTNPDINNLAEWIGVEIRFLSFCSIFQLCSFCFILSFLLLLFFFFIYVNLLFSTVF